MGRSQTIRDKEKADAEFKRFMDRKREEGREKLESLEAQIKKSAEAHYQGNGWDFARLAGDKKGDYQNYKDWSLGRVTNIIQSISQALRAGSIPSKKVPGSEDADKETIENAKANLTAFDSDYDLIIARVTALVSGVLSQFSVNSEAVSKSAFKDIPLAGGLHLFFSSEGSVFQASEFFSRQYIGSFQIVFAIYMSVDEAKAISLSQILKTTGKEIEILNALIIQLSDDMAENLKETAIKDFLSTKQAYKEALDSVKSDRDDLVKEYDKYRSIADTVDAFLPRLDLSEFGVTGKLQNSTPLLLEHLFTQDELGIAQRYLSEKMRGRPEVLKSGGTGYSLVTLSEDISHDSDMSEKECA